MVIKGNSSTDLKTPEVYYRIKPREVMVRMVILAFVMSETRER